MKRNIKRLLQNAGYPFSRVRIFSINKTSLEEYLIQKALQPKSSPADGVIFFYNHNLAQSPENVRRALQDYKSRLAPWADRLKQSLDTEIAKYA